MAGHSKWANIQHRKKAVDAKRGKIFTRINREITVAARSGGGDTDSNPALRLAVEKANAANMPKENIERAIKKATGDLEGVTYEELTYEGYAPGGVAVLVECLTDNRNRTVAEVRHAFTKYGGNLGTDGSVAYLFSKIGVLNFAPGTSEDDVMEVALEAGAEDIVSEEDGSIEVITAPETYSEVKEAMKVADLQPENSEITMRASLEVELDVESGEKVLRFLDALEDLDDTQDVYSNADIPDEAYSSKNLRILGVDPGSRMTGVGIIEIAGDRVTPLYYDVIKAGSGEFTERLGIIFTELQQLIKQYQPDQAAIETVFVAHNAASAIKLGQARGAAVCAAISCNVPVSEYSPRSVKQAIVGRGGADKGQVQHMVGLLLGIHGPIQNDAADALAVALCHQHTSHTLARIAMMQG